ncbi:MAG TPA: AMP-binding protein [Nakamurella sp.]
MENPLTPLRFLQRAASVHPDRTAIIDGGPRSFSYRELAAQVTRLARALDRQGSAAG